MTFIPDEKKPTPGFIPDNVSLPTTGFIPDEKSTSSFNAKETLQKAANISDKFLNTVTKVAISPIKAIGWGVGKLFGQAGRIGAGASELKNQTQSLFSGNGFDFNAIVNKSNEGKASGVELGKEIGERGAVMAPLYMNPYLAIASSTIMLGIVTKETYDAIKTSQAIKAKGSTNPEAVQAGLYEFGKSGYRNLGTSEEVINEIAKSPTAIGAGIAINTLLVYGSIKGIKGDIYRRIWGSGDIIRGNQVEVPSSKMKSVLKEKGIDTSFIPEGTFLVTRIEPTIKGKLIQPINKLGTVKVDVKFKPANALNEGAPVTNNNVPTIQGKAVPQIAPTIPMVPVPVIKPVLTPSVTTPTPTPTPTTTPTPTPTQPPTATATQKEGLTLEVVSKEAPKVTKEMFLDASIPGAAEIISKYDMSGMFTSISKEEFASISPENIIKLNKDLGYKVTADKFPILNKNILIPEALQNKLDEIGKKGQEIAQSGNMKLLGPDKNGAYKILAGGVTQELTPNKKLKKELAGKDQGKNLITRTQLKQLYDNSPEFQDSPLLTVEKKTFPEREDKYGNKIAPETKKVLAFKGTTQQFSIVPEALGLKTENLKIGDKIEFKPESLKVAGENIRVMKKTATGSSIYASAGGEEVGSFENIKDINKLKPEELKLFKKVIELVRKYAKSIGENYLPRNAVGVYNSDTKNIHIKGMNNLSVAAHEITHFLDFAYKISDELMAIKGYGENGNPIYEPGTKAMRKEITNLYEQYYPGGKRNHKLKKRVIEGFATLLQKYIEQPTTITKQYPTLVKEFLMSGGKYYKPVIGEIIKDLQDIVSEYQGLPALDKVGAYVINDKTVSDKDSFLNFWENFKTESVDNIYPSEVVAKIAGVHFTRKDPSFSLRYYNAASTLIENNLQGKRGYWGLRNEELVKLHSYNWRNIIKELNKNKLTQQFGYYLVARNEYYTFQELKELQIKLKNAEESVKSASAIMKDAKEAGADLIEYQAEIRRVIEKYKEAKENYNEVKSILDKDGFTEKEVTDAYLENKEIFLPYEKKFDKLTREDIRFLHQPEIGLVNNDKYRRMTKRVGYAAMQRSFHNDILGEDTKSFSNIRIGKGKISSLIRRKGSRKPIINPLFSAIKNHAEMTRKGLAQFTINKHVQLAIDYPEKLGDVFEVKQLQAVPNGKEGFIFPQEKDPNIIMGRINYKRVPVETNKIIKRTIDEVLNFQNIGIFEQALLTSSRLFTKGTTGVFVGFTLANVPVDTITSFAQTRNKLVPVYDALRTFTKVMMDSKSKEHEYLLKYLILGGERQTLIGWQNMSPSEYFKAITKEREGLMKIVDLVESGVDILGKPSQYSEIMTRATEFAKAKMNGKTDLVALEEAGRVTAPFHHIGRLGGGKFGQVYLKSIPYANASLEVLAQAIETAKNSKGRQRMLFVLLAISAASIAGFQLILSAGTDEQKRQYVDLDPAESNKYIWYPLPGGKGLGKLRVPDIFNMPGTLINMKRADNQLDADYAAKEYLSAVTSWLPQQINPTNFTKWWMSILPQAIKPITLTTLGMKDWPEVIPIESSSVKYREPELRYNDQTSFVARWIGASFKVSPMKVDFLLSGIFGRASQYIIGKPGAFDLSRQLKKDYYPENGRKFRKFYDVMEENNQQYESIKNQRKDYSYEERVEILRTKSKIETISNLMQSYRRVKDEKVSQNLINLIIKNINKL